MNTSASTPPEWNSYEDLTVELVGRLGGTVGVQTTRLERNVPMPGRATTNRIDVMWEFLDANSDPVRMIFECRSYRSTIKQQALHSWRGVVDDVSVDDVPTVGVMVTASGYQRGARAVAETYGIVILELRAPSEVDTAGRLWAIDVAIDVRTPRVVDLQVEAVEALSAENEHRVLGLDLGIEDGLGGQQNALDLLLAGELVGFDEPPTAFHRVVRSFDPPRVLFVEGRPVARIRSLSATVGEVEGEPFEFRVGGLENVAWMLRDAVTGARVWFAGDGRTWSTPD